ncbi:hypothetical protein L195_g011312, partial [Trifolium pratense]
YGDSIHRGNVDGGKSSFEDTLPLKYIMSIAHANGNLCGNDMFGAPSMEILSTAATWMEGKVPSRILCHLNILCQLHMLTGIYVEMICSGLRVWRFYPPRQRGWREKFLRGYFAT